VRALDYTSDRATTLQDLEADDRLARIKGEMKMTDVDQLADTLTTGAPK
jgi:hypothetical protein